jgi:hypothetical protein
MLPRIAGGDMSSVGGTGGRLEADGVAHLFGTHTARDPAHARGRLFAVRLIVWALGDGLRAMNVVGQVMVVDDGPGPGVTQCAPAAHAPGPLHGPERGRVPCLIPRTRDTVGAEVVLARPVVEGEVAAAMISGTVDPGHREVFEPFCIFFCFLKFSALPRVSIGIHMHHTKRQDSHSTV